MPQKPDVAVLPPLAPPGILDQPVVVAGGILPEALREDSVAERRIPFAAVENAALVAEPVVPVDGHHRGALRDERLHQGLRLVAGQRIPTGNPDARGRGELAGDWVLGALLGLGRVR